MVRDLQQALISPIHSSRAMSIDSISSKTTPLQPGDALNFRKARADFQALSSALQSNDLTGAQQDFASLEKDAPALASAVSSSPAVSGTTPLDSFKALSSSLQTGDLSGAKAAMNALQQNIASDTVMHHGHHHHKAYAATAANAAASGQLAGAAGVAPAASGSSLNASA